MSQIIRRRVSPAFYKSFNTIWLRVSASGSCGYVRSDVLILLLSVHKCVGVVAYVRREPGAVIFNINVYDVPVWFCVHSMLICFVFTVC